MSKPPGSKPNYVYTIISVTLVLLLLGLFGLLVIQGQQLVKSLKEQVEIIVELNEGTPPSEVSELKSQLAKSPFFKPNSFRFVSKDEGAKMMQKDFGDDFLKLDMANPLYDVVIFNMVAEHVQTDSMEIIRNDLKALTYVNDVFYQESVADAIASNLEKVSWFILIAGLFFILVAVALILNTIRLALYSNRFLIKNMELVGASWGFISRPFLKRSFWHGLISGILAIGGLSLTLYLVYRDVPDYQESLNFAGITVVFGALLTLGILITVLSTYYVVKKYLRMRVDEMY
jgi:cell division transport system permease protein